MKKKYKHCHLIEVQIQKEGMQTLEAVGFREIVEE